MSHVVVELTNRCNLSCHHCFTGRHGGHDDLPMEAFDQILLEAKACGFDQLSFTGGDPTLHPQFFEIIQRTFDAGYQFGFVTNGWNFAGVFPRLAPYRPALAGVTFSLDGATELTHDGMRGKGSFRRVMKALSVCTVSQMPFSLNMVVTKGNRHELAEMVDLATKLGSQALRFAHLMPSQLAHALDLDLTPVDRKAVESEIRRMQPACPIPLVLAPGHHSDSLFPCAPLEEREMNVDHRGNVTLCCQLSSHGGGAGQADVAGDLAKVSFGEAVRRLKLIRQTFRERKQAYLADGSLRDSDLFACWYCGIYFGKHEWLQETPDHPWSEAVWRPNPDRRSSAAGLVSIELPSRTQEDNSVHSRN